MTDKPILYGFDGSTYVRTVRMVLHEKGAEYDQVPVHVLNGEPPSSTGRVRTGLTSAPGRRPRRVL